MSGNQEFFTQKAINCAEFIDKLFRKYGDGGLNLSEYAQRIKEDKDLREKLINPSVRAMLLMQIPQLTGPIQVFRDLYSCDDDQRLEKVLQAIEMLEDHKTKTDMLIARLKEDPVDVAVDLRRLGAYFEIFFGPLVDGMGLQKKKTPLLE